MTLRIGTAKIQLRLALGMDLTKRLTLAKHNLSKAHALPKVFLPACITTLQTAAL